MKAITEWHRPSPGTDVTIVATSHMDRRTIIESVKRTSRAVVVDEGHLQDGVTAEIASMIADEAFSYQDAPSSDWERWMCR